MYSIDSQEFVSAYDELPLWSVPFGFELMKRIPLDRNAHALDIGCGTGFPLIELAQRLGPAAKVTGIDPWKAALDRAAFKCKVFGVNNVKLVEGKAEQMPFPDASFTLIISNNGLNNVAKPVEALRECRRVGKRGTRLVFTANLPGTLAEFYDVFSEVLSKHGMTKTLNALEKHVHDKRKSIPEWEQILDHAEYRLTGLWENAFNYEFSDGTAFLNHNFIRMAFMPSWLSILSKKQSEGIFGEVEKKLNSISRKAGGLRLSIPFACFECRCCS